MTSMRNEGLTGFSPWRVLLFQYFVIHTKPFHSFENAWCVSVALVAWISGLVLIQTPLSSSGIS